MTAKIKNCKLKFISHCQTRIPIKMYHRQFLFLFFMKKIEFDFKTGI